MMSDEDMINFIPRYGDYLAIGNFISKRHIQIENRNTKKIVFSKTERKKLSKPSSQID